MATNLPSGVATGSPTCTAGFVLRDNSPGTSSTYFGTTAGHCGRSGRTAHIGGDEVGGIGSNTYFPGYSCSNGLNLPCVDADASRFYVGHRSSSSQDAARARVHTWADAPNATDATSHPMVTGQFANAQLTAERPVCFVGTGSEGMQCGHILAADKAMSVIQGGAGGSPPWAFDGAYNPHVWCTDIPIAFNDSGGPVFQLGDVGALTAAGWAVGYYSGIGAPAPCQADKMVFSPIANVLTGLNVTLVTATPGGTFPAHTSPTDYPPYEAGETIDIGS